MPTIVSVEMTVFIPSEVVLYSVLGYGGAFNGGTKCSPKAVLDLDKLGASSMTVGPLAWGTTHRYDPANAVAVAGKPDWYRALRGGASAIESQQLQRTEANLNVAFAQLAGATHAVKFFIEGANPLLTLAPAIDAEIVVGFRKAGGGVQFAASGEHDGFPNYTLKIANKQVYAWDCVTKGEDPSALRPPMDQVVNTGWKTL